MTRKPLFAVAAIVLSALALSACATGTFTSGAAVVNGVGVSEAELERIARLEQLGQQQPAAQVTKQNKRDAIFGAVQRVLLRQEAARRGIEAPRQEIDERVRQVEQQLGGAEQLELSLRQVGLTVADYREVAVRDSVLAGKLREALLEPVTDADVAAVYQQRRDSYREVRARHVLALVDETNTEAEARRRIRRAQNALDAGDSFAAVARRLSQDPGSQERGGSLGWLSLSGLDQTFARAALEAPIGEVVGPVRSQFGFHLILVQGKRVRTLEQVASEIRAELEAQAQQEALGRFFEEQLSEADIVVNPRYGDWDPEAQTVVEHRFFVPASPVTDPSEVGELPPPG